MNRCPPPYLARKNQPWPVHRRAPPDGFHALAPSTRPWNLRPGHRLRPSRSGHSPAPHLERQPRAHRRAQHAGRCSPWPRIPRLAAEVEIHIEKRLPCRAARHWPSRRPGRPARGGAFRCGFRPRRRGRGIRGARVSIFQAVLRSSVGTRLSFEVRRRRVAGADGGDGDQVVEFQGLVTWPGHGSRRGGARRCTGQVDFCVRAYGGGIRVHCRACAQA